MEKYHRSDIVGIERENERDENYISKSNPQIHSEKTPYNFHFINPKNSYISFINQRLKELAPKRKVKDDAVLMSSFFVSNKMSEEIKDSKTTDGISDADMKSLARTLLPILREYLLSDEGRKDYDEWKKKQVNRKLNKKEESR